MTADQHRGLPHKWGPCSNGEFLPPPMSPVLREAQRRAVAQGEANAARLGMSRRRFFSTLSGAAVCLVSLNACASEQKRANGGGEPGGRFDVSTTSTTEPAAAYEELAGHEFIMDVQTHFADHDLTVPLEPGQAFFGSSFPFANCEVGQEGEDARLCFTVDSYLQELFFNSDTSLAVLSALPFPGDDVFMSPASMDETARAVNALCTEDRVLVHGAAFPHHGSLDAALAAMTEARETREIAAWKIYTMLPPEAAFFFDDHDPDRPQIGQAFIDHVREIGPPIICTHKGLKDIVFSDEQLTSPTDIGLAAARNPDISFVVYHSGYEIGHAEEAYSDDAAHLGTNRLIKSLLDAGVQPNSNVYAELGGTWRLAMGDPERAAHVLGKLLKYVGEDRVVWGTDSIWFGSPQDQIQTLRTFQISEEFQERYGYPALTDELKAKIFGLTSAQLYGVDPAGVYCPMTRDELQAAREEVAMVPRTYGPTNATELAAHMRAHGAMG